jgi:putative ABC transport system permease protein
VIASRWKKVVRDLFANFARTALVVLSIAVGVFAIGSVVGARVILAQDLTAQYRGANDASAQIFASNLDDTFVRSIARMPGIQSAQGRSGAVLRVPLADGTRSNLIINTLDAFDSIDINRIRHERGAIKPPRRAVLLERSTLDLFGKQIGEMLTVELGDGKTRDLLIAGTVFDITAPPVRFANFGTAYITPETKEWLGYPANYSQIRIVVNEYKTDREHIQRFVDQIKERIEDSGRVYFGSNIAARPGFHYADEQIQAMLLILNVLGGLAVFLSGFLVTNAIAALMAQHTRQIGIMKTFGARSFQIGAQYLAMVVLLGMAGLLIAVPLGTLGAQGLTRFVGGLLNFDVITAGVPNEVLLLEIGVGLLVPIIAALAPIIGGMRMTVREAIANTGAQSTPNGREDGVSRSRLLTVIPRPLLLSVRNTFRRKTRLLLTVGTLTLASAIFIAVFSVRAALLRTLDQSLQYWNYDVEVVTKTPHGDDKLRRELLNVPGVAHVETWSSANGRPIREDKSEGRPVSIVAPSMPTTLIEPILLRGRWLLPDDSNAIVVNTEFIADEPWADVGALVTLKFGTRNAVFQVIGVVQSTLTGQVRNPRSGYVTQTGLREALTLGRQVSQAVVVTSDSSAEGRQAVARTIEQTLRAVNMPVDTTETMSERRAQIAFQFDLLVTFLMIMAALLAVVGGLGLAGAMSINVFERTREIGIMRAIGGGNGAIRGIVVAEGVFIGLLSWALGALAAAPISYGLNIAVGEAFLRRPLAFAYSFEGMALWCAAVVLLAALSSVLPAIRASSLTVREVLAYE